MSPHWLARKYTARRLCCQSSAIVPLSNLKSEILNHKSKIIHRKSPGFTLLEVILALALSTIVIGAVGLGIFVYYRAFDSGRDEVEEAQLARALLTRIADDIRGAVPYCPIDAEGLVPQASSAGGTGGTSSGTGGTSGDATGTSGDATGTSGDASSDGSASTDGAQSSTTSSLAASVVPPSIPGLYGNDSVLLIDVSRLPRLDQYDAMAVATGDAAVPDRLSDVKTVTYFVNSSGLATGGATSATGAMDGGDQQPGLVRRELDRAVAVWSEQQGAAAFPPPLAPEVGRITFTYFDGSEWTTEWDTVAMGSLPVAVRVEIAMIPRQKRNKGGLFSAGNADPFVEDPKHIYSMVVFLPSSQAARANPSSGTTEEPTDESADTSGDSSGSSSGTGGSSGSSTGGTGGTSGTGGAGSKPSGGTGTGGMGGGTGSGTGTNPNQGSSKRGG